MAGRLGFGPSRVPPRWRVVSCPNQGLALTNMAYCSAGDLRKFAITGSTPVMTSGQSVSFEFVGTNYTFTVNQAMVEGQEKNSIERGIICKETYIVFEAASNSGIKIINQREAASSNIFRQKEFNLQKLGIGGLSEEFTDIFRRAFASRVFPPHVTNKLGIKHVKGYAALWPSGHWEDINGSPDWKIAQRKGAKDC
ncbi:hypothetical protein HPP92_011523 [Vanilla planifolia]|uniref:Vesicle-fusing ATPase n=1 Tax=Vanilla planifolia TaxID=51239 RepID=A0A835QVV0_VANPL|nr:hypothetical protein HPP92_011523 [Vanilla planifolia]